MFTRTTRYKSRLSQFTDRPLFTFPTGFIRRYCKDTPIRMAFGLPGSEILKCNFIRDFVRNRVRFSYFFHFIKFFVFILTFCDRISAMEQDNKFLTIHVNNQCYKAPVDKLVNASGYFAALLSGRYVFKENIERRIDLGQLDPYAFEVVIKFVILDELSFKSNKSIRIYMACLYLQLSEPYLEKVGRIIKKKFNKIDILTLLQYLSYEDDHVLLNDVRRHIAPWVSELLETNDFTTFPTQLMSELLYIGFQFQHPKRPLKIISKWLARDVERKTEIDAMVSSLTYFHIQKVNCFVPEWNEREIFKALDKSLFKPEPKSKIMEDWASNPDQPWFSVHQKREVSFHNFNGIGWTPMAQPTLKFDHEIAGVRSARKNHLVYMFLDHKYNSPETTEFLMFDCIDENYSQLRLPMYRPYLEKSSHETLTIVNESLFCCTGTKVQKYISEINCWAQIPSSKCSQDRVPIYTSDGKLLFSIGSRRSSQPNITPELNCVVEFYDERCPFWKKLPSLPRADFECATYCNGKIYAANLSSMMCLDLRRQKWNECRSPFPGLYQAHDMVRLDDCIYVTDITQYINCYEMTSDLWRMAIRSPIKGSDLNVVNCTDNCRSADSY